MSTCDVEPLRQWMYGLCVRGDGSFDFGSLDALKTRVTLREAKEIEAVVCIHGDNRHTFQTWYGKWAQKSDSKREPIDGDFFDRVVGIYAIDVELVRDELENVERALDGTLAQLQGHRQAIALGRGGTLPAEVVDVLEVQLEGLKVSKLELRAQLDAALGETATKPPPRTGHIDTVVGPVQSGTLRKG